MRPKKRIAIWCLDENVKSLLRVVLTVRGYAVESVTGSLKSWNPSGVDALLIVDVSDAALAEIEKRLHGVPGKCRAVRVAARGTQMERPWTAQVLYDLRLAIVCRHWRERQEAEAPERAARGGSGAKFGGCDG